MAGVAGVAVHSPSRRTEALVDECMRAGGCEPSALATLCASLPREDLEALLTMLVRTMRQQAGELHRLKAERSSWAARTVPALQAKRHRSRTAFLASRGAGSVGALMPEAERPPLDLEDVSRGLHASRSELLWSASKALQPAAAARRPASAQQPRARAAPSSAAEQQRRRSPSPPNPLLRGWNSEEGGDELLRVSTAPKTHEPASGLRSVHALHTHMLYRSPSSLARPGALRATQLRQASSATPALVPPVLNRRHPSPTAAASAGSPAPLAPAPAPAAGADGAEGGAAGSEAAAAAAAEREVAAQWREALLPLLHELAAQVQAMQGQGMQVGGGSGGAVEAAGSEEHGALASRCLRGLQRLIDGPPASLDEGEAQLAAVQQMLEQCTSSPHARRAPAALAASSSCKVTLQRLLRAASAQLLPGTRE